MQRGKLFILLAIICLFVCIHFLESPYLLNYKRIAVNVPVEYSESLKNKEFPLGEKYLAEDMVEAFNKFGYEARVYALEDSYSNRDFREGYEIYLRIHPEMNFDIYHEHLDKDRIAVVFETLHFTPDQLKNADIVFAGSKKKNEEYRKIGINSYYVPQFTRLDKFYFSPKEELKTKVLFVGNRWHGFNGLRKSIQYALNTSIELDVYGKGWREMLPNDSSVTLRGEQIKGDDLKHYYSSAEIVLNDTNQFMIDDEVIPNRVFDVTASKGFLISDYNKAIEEIYGDAIPMYQNEQEFKQLIEYYLAHPDERREKAERAYQITKENFSAEKIVGRMLKIMEEYRRYNLKSQSLPQWLKLIGQKIAKSFRKNVTFRINSRKQLIDYRTFSSIEYLKYKFGEKGYQATVLFGGNLYNPIADEADINVFVRGEGPFLDARMNKKAKNLFFINSEHLYPEEMNNFDGYLTISNEFLDSFKVFKKDDVKLVFGSAPHRLLQPSYLYDVLFISDDDQTLTPEYIPSAYQIQTYSGKEFVKLSSAQKESELSKARLVIYETSPSHSKISVPYAVLNIISYGRPVLTNEAKILKSYFLGEVETYWGYDDMINKIEKLLNEDVSKLEERAQRARQKLMEISQENDIF